MILISLLSFVGPLAVIFYGLQLVSRTLFRFLEHRLKEWFLRPGLSGLHSLILGLGATLITLSPVSNRLFMACLNDLGFLDKNRVYSLVLGTFLGMALMVVVFVPSVLLGNWALLGLLLATLGLPFFQSYVLARNTWGDLLMGWGLIFLGLELLNGGPSLLGRDPEAMALIRWISTRGVGLIFFGLAGVALGAVFRSNLAAPVLAMILGYRGWIGLSSGLTMVTFAFLGSLIEPLLFFQNMKSRGRVTILVQAQIQAMAALSGLTLIPLFETIFGTGMVWVSIGPGAYPLLVAIFSGVHQLTNTVLIYLLLPLLDSLACRISALIPEGKGPSQPSHSMESNILAYKSLASQLLEGTYGMLLALMDLTQSPKLSGETGDRFHLLTGQFKENLASYQQKLTLSLTYQTTQHQARELQTLQSLGVNIETIGQLLERVFRIVAKHIGSREFHFRKIIRRLYRYLSFLLDIERYNQDLLLGKAWNGDVPVVDNLSQAIHNLRRKTKSAIQRLLRKPSSGVRHLVAQLEVLELMHQVVHLEKSLGELLAFLNEKGPETESRGPGGDTGMVDQPPRTT